jgi:hypothetical protein
MLRFVCAMHTSNCWRTCGSAALLALLAAQPHLEVWICHCVSLGSPESQPSVLSSVLQVGLCGDG